MGLVGVQVRSGQKAQKHSPGHSFICTGRIISLGRVNIPKGSYDFLVDTN